MADKITLDVGSGGADVAVDTVGTEDHQLVKVEFGADAAATVVDKASGKALPVQGEAAENAATTGNPVLTGGRYDTSPRTLGDGDVGAIALAVDGAVHIDDGGNAITTDWAGTAPPIGAGTEATALRVTLATDSTGVVSIDDNGGSVTVDGTVTANLSATDNAVLDDIAAKTSDPTVYVDDTGTHATGTSKGHLIMAAATPTDGSVDANDIGALAMSTDRHLLVDAQILGTDVALDVSAATVTVDLGSNNDVQGVVAEASAVTGTKPFLIAGDDGTNVKHIAVDSSGFIQCDLAASSVTQAVSISDPSFAVADGNALGEGVLVQGDDGTDRKNINVDASTGDVQVDITNTVTVSDDGSFVVDLGSNNDVTAVGTIADDSTTPGNPVMIGGTAKETDGTDPGEVTAEDDVTRLITDRNRRLLVNTAHPNMWSANENHSSAQTDNPFKAATGDAGLSLYLCTLVMSNGGTAGNMKIVEDTASAATVAGPYYFAANGGLTVTFDPPIRITANKDLGLTSVDCVAHTVTATGYTAP